MGDELDGVSSAEGGGACLARGVEIESFAAAAGGAVGLLGQVRGLNVTEGALPDIDECESAIFGGDLVGEDFDSGDGLPGSDDIDGGSEDSGGVAGFCGAWGRGRFDEAAEAG